MSHLLLWPKTTFFYLIANTPAVSLTHDLAAEDNARILLLGCGDLRNMFTNSLVYDSLREGCYHKLVRIALFSYWLHYCPSK
ncbi:hypothetical protein DL96DRAFT_746579 [Flagelloscypha sp. PMI_526]|nr:hypothetical protein DL96DRAFT_746579 [Flagelloscypha sp. PMI_526]